MSNTSDTACPLSVTDAKTNFIRFEQLVIDGGTCVLKQVLDKFHPPEKLATILADSHTKEKLNSGLTRQQREKLYPAPETYGKSEDFDISILCRVLKDTCGLPPPNTAKGWFSDHEPAKEDISLSDDVLRIRLLRNRLMHSRPIDKEMQDKDFNDAWENVKGILIRLASFVSANNATEWRKTIDKWLKKELTAESLLQDTKQDLQRLKERHAEDLDKLLKKLDISDERKTNEDHQTEEKEVITTSFDISREDSKKPSSENDDVASNLSPVASLEIRIKIKTQDTDLLQRLTKFFLDQYKTEPQALEERLKRVLPNGGTLVNVFEGSIVLVIQVSSTKVLEALWNNYKNGQLNEALQNVLITDEVKAAVGAQEIAINLEIREDHYNNAIEKLQKFQLQAVLNNPTLLDDLARCLDRELNVIKHWKHLAHELGVPSHMSRQIEISYRDLSPSVHLFQYLQATNPKLTVGQLKEELKKDNRNDIVKLLESNCNDTDLVAEKVTNDEMLLGEVAVALDTGKKPIANWRSLAARLKIRGNTIDSFVMDPSQNPTKTLFAHLSRSHPDLTVQTLRKCLRKMERIAAVDVLQDYKDEDLVKKVILPDSDVAKLLQEKLNRTVPGVGNWKKLAFELGVSESEYGRWDPTANKTVHSPTKLLLEWLSFNRPEMTLNVMAEALQKIDRYDAVQILDKILPDISKPTGPN